MLRNYWKAELGYDTIYDDNGFCAYVHNDDEFFIAHLYVENRKSGGSYKFFNKIKELAKTLGASYLTGNIDLNEANREEYTNKLLIQLRHGYKILNVTDKRITVIKYL